MASRDRLVLNKLRDRNIANYWEAWRTKNAEKRVAVMVRIPRPPPPEPEAVPDEPEEQVEVVDEPPMHLSNEMRDALLRELTERRRHRAAPSPEPVAREEEPTEPRRRRAAPRSVQIARGEQPL